MVDEAEFRSPIPSQGRLCDVWPDAVVEENWSFSEEGTTTPQTDDFLDFRSVCAAPILSSFLDFPICFRWRLLLNGQRRFLQQLPV